MINLSRVVNDPRISQEFKVFRKKGDWIKGRFSETETELCIRGVIVPATNKEIEMVPEGDRVKGAISIHSTKILYTTRSDEEEEGTSDEIEWENERYKVYSLGSYSKYGFYSAIGMRLVSN